MTADHLTVIYEFYENIIFMFFPLLVAGAVADINKKVAEGESQNTLQALLTPSAGLRAVLPECADSYQAELAQKQDNIATKGNWIYVCNIKGSRNYALF